MSDILYDGRFSAEFEKLISEYVENKYVCLCSDFSTSVMAILYLLGVKSEDEIISTPMSCMSLNMHIKMYGANIVWCDVCGETGNLNCDYLEKIVNKKTKAIFFSNWSGNVYNIDRLKEISQYGIPIIEDASNSFGAFRGGKIIGNDSDFTLFSFGAVKHLNAINGSAICFKNKKDYFKMKKIRKYGIDKKTFRLDNGNLNDRAKIIGGYDLSYSEINAFVGIEQLKDIKYVLGKYRENGGIYEKELKCDKIKKEDSVYWTYSFLCNNRDKLIGELYKNNICSQRLHVRNDKYSFFNKSNIPLKGTKYFDAHNISVPCGWWVNKDIERIIEIVNKFLK